SRRRHTRSKRDWSSDVCSSDLTVFPYRKTSKTIYHTYLSKCSNKIFPYHMMIRYHLCLRSILKLSPTGHLIIYTHVVHVPIYPQVLHLQYYPSKKLHHVRISNHSPVFLSKQPHHLQSHLVYR